MTVYGEDPLEMAQHWVDEGGTYLHVVDLDGAFQGAPVHTEVIGRIIAKLDIPVEVGGGIRTDEDIQKLVDVGVDRVILGTRAYAEPDALAALVQRFGAHIAVGIDARDGQVQVKGWVETTDVSAVDLATQIDAMGVKTLIYTDTARDGMLMGPNLEQMDRICSSVGCHVIASGGVSTCENIESLAALNRDNLRSAIVGKALYERSVTVKELQAAACAV